MSFFGFNSAQPGGSVDQDDYKSKGMFDHRDPFAQVQQARKLRAFQDVQDEPPYVSRHPRSGRQTQLIFFSVAG